MEPEHVKFSVNREFLALKKIPGIVFRRKDGIGLYREIVGSQSLNWPITIQHRVLYYNVIIIIWKFKLCNPRISNPGFIGINAENRNIFSKK